MSNLADRIPELQKEIVVRVEAIKLQQEGKKSMMASYNENIKALKAEQDLLLSELNATKDQVKEDALVEAADKILDSNPTADNESLSLID